MSKRKETWWTVKYQTASGEWRMAGASYEFKIAANDLANRYRGLGAKKASVVPCDPPVLRKPIKERKSGT